MKRQVTIKFVSREDESETLVSVEIDLPVGTPPRLFTEAGRYAIDYFLTHGASFVAHTPTSQAVAGDA